MRSLSLSLLLSLLPVFAAAQEPLLTDRNGDGEIKIVAVGDSITSGIGDLVLPSQSFEVAPPAPRNGGYPARVADTTGVEVENRGVPGEEFIDELPFRFASVLRTSRADIVLILGGSNDAIFQRGTSSYRRALQSILNIAAALGVQPIVLTIPGSCCDHEGLSAFTRAYSQIVRELGDINSVPVVDVEAAWDEECSNPSTCSLLVRPEGLHPNVAGYDLMGKLVSETLLGEELDLTPQEEADAADSGQGGGEG